MTHVASHGIASEPRCPPQLEPVQNLPPQRLKSRRGETNKQAVSGISSSKLHDKFAAVFAPRCVEELSEPCAPKVVLNVPRIKVIEEIEDASAHPGVQALFAEVQSNWTRDLEVKGRKARETAYVPRSNIFAELVFCRIRESGV